MPDHVEPFEGLRHDGLNTNDVAVLRGVKLVRQVYLAPVDAGGEGLFGGIAVELSQSLADRDGRSDALCRAILDLDVDLAHRLWFSLSTKIIEPGTKRNCSSAIHRGQGSTRQEVSR